MERESKSSFVRLDESLGESSSSTTRIFDIAELLALGYLRYRKRQARDLAKKPALITKKSLDDVAPGGRVAPTEIRTSETVATDE